MRLRWWSIEVLDGPRGTARAWRDSLGNSLVEAAVTNGAYRWEWHVHTWGVLFEIAFRSDEAWAGYRALPLVTAALDAVPDPAHGLTSIRAAGAAGGARCLAGPGRSRGRGPPPSRRRTFRLSPC